MNLALVGVRFPIRCAGSKTRKNHRAGKRPGGTHSRCSNFEVRRNSRRGYSMNPTARETGLELTRAPSTPTHACGQFVFGSATVNANVAE